MIHIDRPDPEIQDEIVETLENDSPRSHEDLVDSVEESDIEDALSDLIDRGKVRTTPSWEYVLDERARE